ncbi:CgeB family protein [Gulosibacter sp. ACHW.36C]|uniref:Glycosyltransferase n=1 Tax=Gulosibacter sediminis TaxID=1729695 RepID=A0ABY4MYJ6_9MICO|nr:hypothetical protein [Gulosibacter sediminis]UQN15094.1 hypothetical protein M3M28_01090 [Gulosibacter sediminis]
MKIAFYDGILETHVADSLERALVSRGHNIFNTGKIGHGFEFANGKVDLQRLQLAVNEVLEFAPDWVLVFRPASLPIPLLELLRSRGAKVAAWFSDDPVLFDLTYGPIVNSYDLILHCGNADVLSFYEHQFGRPTGVNVPFWTDHVAFPDVWGTEPATTDALFLGNVQDEVRRQRYFDLAKLDAHVTIYGNVGNDYYGLSGGYLDSDEEVVAAGARSNTAISVPQFFKNHKGMTTWFPGLDRLGFFEYPSRIVQYMAMGLPVFNVIPGKPEFATFPEMIVCDSFQEVDERYAELRDSNQLADLSRRTVQRFDRHFSAMSRALLLEDLFENDDWRTSDVDERASWFTRYDALSIPSKLEQLPTESNPINLSRGDNDRREDHARLQHPRVGLFGIGWTQATSRVSTYARAIASLGLDVQTINPASWQGSLVEDPGKTSKFALNVTRLSPVLNDIDVLIVCGVDASITSSGRKFLNDRNVRAVFVDDTGNGGIKRLERLASRYDTVATSSTNFVAMAADHGMENVAYAPHAVDSEFLEIIARETAPSDRSTRWRDSAQAEEAAAPCFTVDLRTHATLWSELEALDLEQLAERLHTRIGFASFGGNRSNPRVSRFMPYLAAAAEWLVIPRHVGSNEVATYQPFSLQVREPGELPVKLRQLTSSARLRNTLATQRQVALETTIRAEHQVKRLICEFDDALSQPEVDANHVSVDHTHGSATFDLSQHAKSGSRSLVLNLGRVGYTTSMTDTISLSVIAGDKLVWNCDLADIPGTLLVGWQTQAQLSALKLRLSAAGGTKLSRREWAGIQVTVSNATYSSVAVPLGVYAVGI